MAAGAAAVNRAPMDLAARRCSWHEDAVNEKERRIALAGTCNFRDLGGYEVEGGGRVRRGVLFRSDNLSRLDPRAFGTFRALGIRTVVDLRTLHERASRPNRLPVVERHEHAPISIVPELERPWSTMDRLRFLLQGHAARFDEAFLEEAYRGLPERAAPALARIFGLLAEGDRAPMLFLCMGGKDRTGFCAAIVLLALGVARQTVFDDYCFTNVCAKQRVDRLLRAVHFASKLTLGRVAVRREAMRAFLEARPAYLEAALAVVASKHGGVEGYLEGPVGLGRAARGALRDRLVEER